MQEKILNLCCCVAFHNPLKIGPNNILFLIRIVLSIAFESFVFLKVQAVPYRKVATICAHKRFLITMAKTNCNQISSDIKTIRNNF